MKKKILTVLSILLVFAVLLTGGYFALQNIREKNRAQREENPSVLKEGYLRSEGKTIELFTRELNIGEDFLGRTASREAVFTPAAEVPRGTAASLMDLPELNGDGNVIYERLTVDGKEYFAEPGHFTEDLDDVISEKTRYVRTPVTIYKNSEDNRIAGFAPKGSELVISGCDRLNGDGSVNMYKVSYEGTEGYVFSKYLAETKEEADALYNEHGEADFHRNAVASYETYGGDPLLLDYYPYEKPVFENNALLKKAGTMYLCVGCSDSYQAYLDCAVSLGINAVCIDIFDDILGFDSEAAKEYSPSNYDFSYWNRAFETENWAAMVKAFQDAGIYTIGRIVVFKDTNYSYDHPENCIDWYGTNWPSVYSRGVWEYKVALGIEAVRRFGFNEIQFDYVRFPEDVFYMNGAADFRNIYNETKSQGIQNFLYYACDMIHREGAYVSVDVFGSSASGVVTENGQYWPAISNIVDVISGMPYTDHFGSDDPSYWEDPYGTLYWWGGLAAPLQKSIPTPAVARTWITGYNTPCWGPYLYYGAREIDQQASGLRDAGLDGGFLVWNGGSDLQKYYDIGWAWQSY